MSNKNVQKHPIGIALGEIFRKMREQKGYSYQDLKALTGVKASYILAFEKANACLGAATAIKMLSYFPIISYSSFITIISIISVTTEDRELINEEQRVKLFTIASHNNPPLKEVLDAYDNPELLTTRLENYLFFTPRESLSEKEIILANALTRKMKENEKIANIVYNLLEL